MSFLSSLLAWESAPFTVALGVALGFAVLQMTGLLGLIAGGGDHEGDADHDVDADSDVDHEVDADGDADADHDADADEGDEADGHGHGLVHGLLAGMGVGRAPLSILWETFAVAFGFAGIAANTVYLRYQPALSPLTLAWTVPGALVFAYAVTRTLGNAVGKLVSNPNENATSRLELVGRTGVVISSKIDGEFGEVRVLDKTGHTVRIICRTRDERQSIGEGKEVVIVDYDGDEGRLYVAPLDEDDEPPEQARRAS